MNTPSREDLLGYLLGALDATEQELVENHLRQYPELESELHELKAHMEPLGSYRDRFETPAGLARRTCEYVAKSIRDPSYRVKLQSAQPPAKIKRQLRPSDIAFFAVGSLLVSLVLTPLLASRAESPTVAAVCKTTMQPSNALAEPVVQPELVVPVQDSSPSFQAQLFSPDATTSDATTSHAFVSIFGPQRNFVLNDNSIDSRPTYFASSFRGGEPEITNLSMRIVPTMQGLGGFNQIETSHRRVRVHPLAQSPLECTSISSAQVLWQNGSGEIPPETAIGGRHISGRDCPTYSK